jgi:hypothetical protein
LSTFARVSPALLSRLLPALGFAAAAACTPPSQPTAETPPTARPPSAQPGSAAATPAKPPPGEWTFDFKDPPAGPRAPTYAAFNVTVGTTKFSEIGPLVERLGLDCGDTSIRAMMDRRREKELARIDAAKARGEDAVTAASWIDRRSKREANPQVRYSCPKITADKLGDRTRAPSTGRLLYVFDSVDHPVRHASYQRTHQNHAEALADFNETLAALTTIYGPPTRPMKSELPRPAADGTVEFPSAVSFEATWEYGDLLVRANILRYGKLVTVGERVEVPHGLRPDAPQVNAAATPRPAAVNTPSPAPAPAAPQPTPTPGAAPDTKADAPAKPASDN